MSHPLAVAGFTLGAAMIAWSLISKYPYGTLSPYSRPTPVWALRFGGIFQGLFCIGLTSRPLIAGPWQIQDALGVLGGFLVAVVGWCFNRLMHHPETGWYTRDPLRRRLHN